VTDFRISTLEGSSVQNLSLAREEIWLDPPYQRQSDIWPLWKKQLLIDSLIQGFDVPKFYFHEFFPIQSIDGVDYRYAIIDGKQRLSAIWEFLDGKYPLASDIELIKSPDAKVAGMTYGELGAAYPRIRASFDARNLAVVTIQTDDVELIEEMFSRLNEAVPLSAAEKRNALGGPLPPHIRSLASSNRFFSDCVPFTNSRYRHFDLAVKYLYLSHVGGLEDTKKVRLDRFVREFKESSLTAEADALRDRVDEVLDYMSEVFVSRDPLLRSVGSCVLYFQLFREALDEDFAPPARLDLERFEQARLENRRRAEAALGEADYDLLEYDRFAQSPNDGIALRFRFSVLKQFLGLGPGPETPEDDFD
jgi:hypothetical protein